MDEPHHPTPATLLHLWRTLESSVNVRNRGELFLWAQGQLQPLVPHGLMVCMMFDAERQVIHSDCLQSVLVEERTLDTLRDPKVGFLVRLQRQLSEAGVHSLEFGVGASYAAEALQQLSDEWERYGLGAGLVQGSGPLADGRSSIFVFTCMTRSTDPVQGLMLRVLLPQLHLALSRSQAWPQQALASQPSVDTQLSERQLEILHWVKLGKTNYEISLILAISELTVKNHLQKIFKKLNVHNRTQAVARIMSMGLDGVPPVSLQGTQ
jgi:transcriptional regulator EpsA